MTAPRKSIFYLSSLILMLICNVSFAQPEEMNNYERPKIGLVLSGGGALGFAHIPILQLIDSLDIPIDYIAGTSMGGIASGLYSIGYSGDELEYIVKSADWEELFTDAPSRDITPYFLKKDDGLYQLSFGLDKNKIRTPSGLIRGQKISLFFSKLTYPFEKVDSFDQFPIPYRCIAVDLLSSNEVVLKEGSLAKAMRSTMAIPTIFNPVSWGDSLLIDGGLLNNMPVDVVRKMGADYVIAVNVGRPLKSRSELYSMFNMLEQTLVIPSIKKRKENIANTDLFIEPDLEGYNAAGFNSENVHNIIEVGRVAAYEVLPKLVELRNILLEQELMKSDYSTDSLMIFRINISGNTSFTFKQIYDILSLRPGTPFDHNLLIDGIQQLRSTNAFQTVDYKLTYMDNDRIGINILVKELGIPNVFRLSIRNNKSIPFSTIQNILGIKIGDPFDIELLNKKITELYSTEYFETIRYEIEPVKKNEIHLIVEVEEKPRDILRLGLHYDETNKFVGSINVVKTNLYNTGLRFESTIKLAGLTQFSNLLYFPTNKNRPAIYPFSRFVFKDIPITIFGATGDRIAIYHNRSTTLGFGFGLNINRNWDSTIEYNLELMNVTPIVAYHDSEIFPEWKDKLSIIRTYSNFDNLDNKLIPNRGMNIEFNYETSQTKFGSDLNYSKFDFGLDLYQSLTNKDVIHFYTYYGHGNEDLPVYKWHYKGGPQSFIGAIRDELNWYQLSIFRIDYRRKLNRNLYLSLIYNIVPNYNLDFYPIPTKYLDGFGIGLTYNTILGPIEFMYSRGDLIRLVHTAKQRDVFYLSMGYNF